jgi:hypothetical protein
MKVHRKAIKKLGKWQCVRCGSKNYQKELLFSEASCKCGIGKGCWASRKYKVIRASMNRKERKKDDRRVAKLREWWNKSIGMEVGDE